MRAQLQTGRLDDIQRQTVLARRDLRSGVELGEDLERLRWDVRRRETRVLLGAYGSILRGLNGRRVLVPAIRHRKPQTQISNTKTRQPLRSRRRGKNATYGGFAYGMP